jgi:hypothetical protein
MRDYSAEDRAQRERLQKNSGPGEGRADLSRIVGMAAVDAVAGRSVEGTLGALRNMAQSQPAIARAHNMAHDAWLRRRRVAAGRPDFVDQDDARDERHVTPVSASGRSPGVDRITDSGGSIDADARTRADHFGGQGIHDAMEVLSVEDMRHLAAQKWRSRFF